MVRSSIPETTSDAFSRARIFHCPPASHARCQFVFELTGAPE